MKKKSTMRTTTVRLEASLMELLERLAELSDESPSEFMRTAIRERIARLGREDARARKIQDELLERRIAEERAAAAQELAMEPVDDHAGDVASR